MQFSLNVKAEDLKVLHKIEFNQKASKKLILSLLSKIPYYNDDMPQTAYYEKFDLNGDKLKEYFLYINEQGWCGAGNCPIFILSKDLVSTKLLIHVSSGAEIYILHRKTNGYHDITFFPKTKVNKHIWRWNGKQYE